MSKISNSDSSKSLLPWLGGLFSLDALGLGWAAFAIFRVSGGSGNALLFGLSAQSLFLVGICLLGAVGLFAAGLAAWRGNRFIFRLLGRLSTRPSLGLGLLTIICVASWLLFWTPAESFKTGYYYALRLLPLAGWLAFASGSGGLFGLAALRGVRSPNWRAALHDNRALMIASGAALAFMALVAWLASVRIFDVTVAEEDFWYGAGVPVLAWQVLTAIFFGLAAAWAEKKFLGNGEKVTVGRIPVEAVVFITVWVVAGIIWASGPLAFNFMVSKPFPPNFEPYPAADGQNYDLASQFALIGQGLFNGGEMVIYFERPLYAAFLFYLHLLAGQNFALLLALQAAMFAVLPALAYLIGKSLHSRGAGIGLAVLFTLRGFNGLLAGSMLDTSTPKMFLTDFPTAIGMAVILLLAIRWVKNPQQNWGLAGWISGCIGLWGFVRPHIFFLLPIVGLLGLGLYFHQKRALFAVAGFMLAAYLAVTMPWVQFNGSGVSLLSMYLGRVQSIIRERYPDFPLPQPGSSRVTRQVASLDPLPIRIDPRPKSISESALDHFLNNLTRSALSLPSTFRNEGLTKLVKERETYWKPYWNGNLSPSARVFLPINLALIALGLGAAWKRARFSGLFPLLGMLIYYLLNSLARTSGGRYLVPVDWVAVLYYGLGLAALIEFVAAWFNAEPTAAFIPPKPILPQPGQVWKQGLLVLILLGMLGSLIPLSNIFYPRRYLPADKFQLLAKVQQNYLEQLGLSETELRNFLAQPASILIEGRALYPRYIWRGSNPFIPGNLLTAKRYSRLALMVIGAHGRMELILPQGDEWSALPNASDVLILGCQTQNYIDGWAIILEQTSTVHRRLPSAKLTCPLPEPVCDENGNCE